MLCPRQQRTSGNEQLPFLQLSPGWDCRGFLGWLVLQEWLLVAELTPAPNCFTCFVSLFSEVLCGILVSQGTLSGWKGSSSASSLKPLYFLHAFRAGSALCHGGGLLATPFSCHQLKDAACEIPFPSEGWAYPALCQTQSLPHIHCLLQP